jgi:2-oxoglutarate ferredoxin oxidoreductase subunit alpha
VTFKEKEYDEAKHVLLEGSLLIIESLARAGADVFIGYPITPANLLYLHGSKRFPAALAAPDEITTLQWMAGYSAAGKIPVTATSFPGFALMIESINMAYMMELPMVIILAQRLGPATGTATVGAQGDVLLLNGAISGGYPLPTLCISSIEDCWTLPARAVQWAIRMRSPVVLLTSKDDVMTMRNFDLSALPEIEPIPHPFYQGEKPYQSYLPEENLVPAFLPVGNKRHQVRLTASTHNPQGILQNSSPEALENTGRLQAKLEKNISDYTFYELDEDEGANTIVFSYGITAQAAREAVKMLRREGSAVSLLIAGTLFPLPSQYMEILRKYPHVIIAEENLNGQMRQVLFGHPRRAGVIGVNAIARMITPEEIVREVKKHESN